MKNVENIYLSKIVYSQTKKKYNILFKSSNGNMGLCLNFNNKDAKNIAMVSENIYSPDLSQYELFVNLLNLLKMDVDNINIFSNKNNTIMAKINLLYKSKKIINLVSDLADSIIISLMTLSDIYIDSELLKSNVDINNNFKYQEDSIIKKTFYSSSNDSINQKVKILKNALNQCVDNENYESAAFLRDRINGLKSK